MLVEGVNVVRELLNSNKRIEKIIAEDSSNKEINNLVDRARGMGIKVEVVKKQDLERIAKSKTQGIVAFISSFRYTTVENILLQAERKNKPAFIVMLDGIVDPHNFGAIIRSCECAGVDGIIIPKIRAVQVNETVIRTSTGAIANMKIAKVTNIKDAITTLKENDVWVFGAEANGENIYSKNLNLPIAIVIGSEGFGVKKTVLSYCDGVLSLPLHGKVNSLNASVACGICVFEALRQRSK